MGSKTIIDTGTLKPLALLYVADRPVQVFLNKMTSMAWPAV